MEHRLFRKRIVSAFSRKAETKTIGTRAVLEVISETPTSKIIDEMTSEEFDVQFQVTSLTGNRIEIRFTD